MEYHEYVLNHKQEELAQARNNYLLVNYGKR